MNSSRHYTCSHQCKDNTPSDSCISISNRPMKASKCFVFKFDDSTCTWSPKEISKQEFESKLVEGKKKYLYVETGAFQDDDCACSCHRKKDTSTNTMKYTEYTPQTCYLCCRSNQQQQQRQAYNNSAQEPELVCCCPDDSRQNSGPWGNAGSPMAMPFDPCNNICNPENGFGEDAKNPVIIIVNTCAKPAGSKNGVKNEHSGGLHSDDTGQLSKESLPNSESKKKSSKSGSSVSSESVKVKSSSKSAKKSSSKGSGKKASSKKSKLKSK